MSPVVNYCWIVKPINQSIKNSSFCLVFYIKKNKSFKILFTSWSVVFYYFKLWGVRKDWPDDYFVKSNKKGSPNEGKWMNFSFLYIQWFFVQLPNGLLGQVGQIVQSPVDKVYRQGQGHVTMSIQLATEQGEHVPKADQNYKVMKQESVYIMAHILIVLVSM